MYHFHDFLFLLLVLMIPFFWFLPLYNEYLFFDKDQKRHYKMYNNFDTGPFSLLKNYNHRAVDAFCLFFVLSYIVW